MGKGGNTYTALTGKDLNTNSFAGSRTCFDDGIVQYGHADGHHFNMKGALMLTVTYSRTHEMAAAMCGNEIFIKIRSGVDYCSTNANINMKIINIAAKKIWEEAGMKLQLEFHTPNKNLLRILCIMAQKSLTQGRLSTRQLRDLVGDIANFNSDNFNDWCTLNENIIDGHIIIRTTSFANQAFERARAIFTRWKTSKNDQNRADKWFRSEMGWLIERMGTINKNKNKKQQ